MPPSLPASPDGDPQNRPSRAVTRSADFPRWYQEAIADAELADRSPVRGCMILRPNGYAIWEAIQRELDPRFRRQGVRNAYFPLFIPLSFIQREAQHVEGFSPELAIVTHAGDRELEEPLVVRPTSETIIWDTFRRWIHGHRDLPLLLNQWCNVVRWEKRPRAFLRTTEFLWQEGHTAHATAADAREFALRILRVYLEFMREVLSLSPVVGEKPPHERFAGAVATFTLEPMMQDGRALQAGTSHDLGDNFGRAFDVTYQAADGSVQSVHATSWGVSTRLVGAVVMAHGDDVGVVFPPAVAPCQVVVVPVLGKGGALEQVGHAARKLADRLDEAGLRVEVDDRPDKRLGAKFFEWERKGAPVRIVVGTKEVEAGTILMTTRHDGRQESFAAADALGAVTAAFARIAMELRARAEALHAARTTVADNRAAVERAVAQGYALSRWCEELACADFLKESTSATVRCFPLRFEQGEFYPYADDPGPCAWCGRPARRRAILARAY